MPVPSVDLAAVGPVLTGFGLMVAAATAWLLPFNSSLLEFSEAETQFLFPAPVSRRWLIIHRLIRSQLGMLFTSAVVAIASPSLDGYLRLRVAFAVWLLLCTVRVYFTGVTLSRARLLAGHAGTRRVAWLPLAVIAAAFGVVATALVAEFGSVPVRGAQDLFQRLASSLGSGAARAVLAPFVAVAWPLYADWPQPYLTALLASAAVLTASVVWVMLSDRAFQDAAEAAADRRSKWQGARASQHIAPPLGRGCWRRRADRKRPSPGNPRPRPSGRSTFDSSCASARYSWA